MNPLKITLITLSVLAGMMVSLAHGLAAMSDDSMSEVTGQSLFSTNYIAPGGSNPNVGVGFYRVGVEANIAINANINKLRLGCDGPGGTGACDISIDRLRLTGFASTAVNSNEGPLTDFLINQPFFEFAIKNPDNPATRQVVGIRFGALEALGRLSIGENPDTTTLADDTGLNTLSGDLNLNIKNAKLTNVRIDFPLVSIIPLNASIDESFSQQVIVKRATQVDDLGPLTAIVEGVAGLGIPLLNALKLTNAHLLNTPLNSIHNIDVKDPSSTAAAPVPTKDFSLSMQGQDINWQKVSAGNFSGVTAQQGWWISIPQVVFQDLVVNDRIDVPLGDVLGGLFGTRVELAGVDLGMRPVDNCWGASTFC